MAVPLVTFSQTSGPLGDLFNSSGVSHSVKIPLSASLVVTSGQPGFNLRTGQLVTESIEKEIEACFNCVEAALKAAGVKNGLAAVHKFTAFLLDIRLEQLMMEVWRRQLPEHRPAWVDVGVSHLAVPGMHIELQAEAVTFEQDSVTFADTIQCWNKTDG